MRKALLNAVILKLADKRELEVKRVTDNYEKIKLEGINEIHKIFNAKIDEVYKSMQKIANIKIENDKFIQSKKKFFAISLLIQNSVLHLLLQAQNFIKLKDRIL